MIKTKSSYLALVAVLLSPMAANADLIDTGDTTLDTSSGLEWLDLTLTAGQSYDEIIAGFGGYVADGWAYASTEQLCALFAVLGDVTGCGLDGLREGEIPDASTFISLFGDTTGGLGSTRGFYDGGSLGDGLVGIGCVNESALFCTELVAPPSWLTLNDAVTTDSTFVSIGSRLVRPTSVPEPGTLALLGIGLLGMGAARRRKKV